MQRQTRTVEPSKQMQSNGWSNQSDLLNLFIASKGLLNIELTIDIPGPFPSFVFIQLVPRLMSHVKYEIIQGIHSTALLFRYFICYHFCLF